MGKLKLYVWENVLHEYKAGIMFAYAKTTDEARELIGEKLGYEHDDLRIEPRQVKDSEGFYVYGGS